MHGFLFIFTEEEGWSFLLFFMKNVQTQAHNFASACQAGVDQRTGIFSFSLPLATLSGHQNLGPFLSLRLNYSPLQSQNAFGLGTGVSLGLTSYDASVTPGRLQLASGEQYRVDHNMSNTTLTLRQCRRPLTLKIDMQGTGEEARCVVRHSSGVNEYLKEFPKKMWLPVRITSAEGRNLTLSWRYHAGAWQLTHIKGHSGGVLCRFNYDDFVSVTLWPETPEVQTFSLWTTNGYLKKICNTSQAGSPRAWLLNYENSNDDSVVFPGQVRPLSQLITPAGMTQTVSYAAGRMRYNTLHGDGGLPAVVRSLLSRGPNQPVQEITYRYSDNSNYLGYGAQFQDFNENDENLFSVPGSHYTYWSEERLKHSDGGEHITRRTYNKFHLLTEERFTQGEGPDVCSHVKTTTYHADENLPFSGQPVTYQFPKQQQQRWQKGNTSSPLPDIATWLTYDEHGHQTRQVMANGCVIEMQWYPAEGEPGKCPADPGGFSRFMKSRTVYPPLTKFKDEPVTRTEYTYANIAARATPHRSPVIMPLAEMHYLYIPADSEGKHKNQDISLIRHTVTYCYYDDVTSDDFGRLRRKTSAFYNEKSPGHPYIRHLDYSFSVRNHQVTRTVTLTVEPNAADADYTRLTQTSSDTVSVLSGLVHSQTDAAGNIQQNQYDVFGRQTHTILHPDDNTWRMESCVDRVFATESSPAWVTTTDKLGNRTRVTHDALGQSLMTEMQDKDGPVSASDVWHPMIKQTRDAWGRITKSVQTDYLREMSADAEITTPAALDKKVENWTTLSYDHWGQVRTTTGSDGIVYHSEADPVVCTARHWTTGREGKDTAHTVTHHDRVTYQVVRTEVFASGADFREHKPYSVTHQEWDGLGRLRIHTDPLGRTTRYEYDIFSRLLRTVMPDNTTITRRYAGSGSHALPVAVMVRGAGESTERVLGEQRFDPLGRPVSRTVGGRTTTYSYDSNPAARPGKNTVTGPDGVTQHYLSEPRLGGALTEMSAVIPDGKTVVKTFRYTPKTGQMAMAKESDSEVMFHYAPSGRSRGTTTTLRGGKALTAGQVSSLGGRVQREVREDGSVWTHNYSTSGHTAGLPTEMTDGKTVSVVFSYDTLNRICGTKATALSSRHELTTSIKRDVFGREVGRIFTYSTGERRALQQEYDVAGRVIRRTLYKGDRHGECLTDERFVYDIRSRLKDYQVTGSLLPRDAYGNAIVRQTFTVDALDNITECVTKLKTGEQNTAVYHYRHAKAPCQLSDVSNTLTSRGYPSKISLLYDKAGRLVRDETGRTLHYDATGRLSRVESPAHGSGDYGYDAFGRMAWQKVDSTQRLHRLYYAGPQLSNEWISPASQKQQSDTDKVIRYLGTVAQTTLENHKEETLLLGADQKHSVMAVCHDTLKDHAYTPYGQVPPHDDTRPQARKGYNGERRDPVTGTSHLGNGYRAYNPVLMRFHCPDSLSPFGAGGLNPYAYCGSDPVNHADPSGHVNWWSVGFGIFSIVAGTIAAVLLAPVTGGASLVLLAVVTASAVASGALDIASGALEDSNPELSKKLGTAALVVGIPAMIDGVARLPGLVKAGYQMVREAPQLLRTANELYNSGVRSLLKARSTLSAVRTQGLSGGAAAAGIAMAQDSSTARFFRVDIAPPSTILNTGFSGNNTPRVVKLFGDNTIFAARTLDGIDAFRSEISSHENLFGSARKYYFEQIVINGYVVEKPKTLHLYEISLDEGHQHEVLSDFFKKQGSVEHAFNITYDGDVAHENIQLNMNMYKDAVAQYAQSYIPTQEVQIRGPIHPRNIRYIPPQDIPFMMD
ncbi:RHS repeat domain-containing protein [Serratia liquefaciens]|uniref:Teneurin-like YD-shell domain-containing protein n=1 Tax=Serratia liquefaciens TaxID=614 RepID=A0ABX7DDE4_SERLI|nr:RHS repeat-associated core domain-containing protein [Serratia liquefaciens]QQU57997.1 hypothetical protein I6I38_25650 [Serratia liquefaciens]